MTQLAKISTNQELLAPVESIELIATRATARRARTWPYALFGLAILSLLIGGIGYWAVVARLAGAVVASAEFTVASKRKTVQHLDGGIVRDILVGEGDRVQAGQVLVRLDNTVDQANYTIVDNELRQLQAQRTRLLAELSDARTLTFDNRLHPANPDKQWLSIRDGQRKLFEARLRSRECEDRIRRNRISKLEKEIAGIERQRNSNDRQIAFIDDELRSLQKLVRKNLVPRRRFLALQREAERIRGQSAALNVNIIRAQSTVDEITLEGLQAQRQFREQVTTELRTIEPRISTLAEQKVAAAKKLSLIEIKAPVNGFVVDLKVHTMGGVVRPGEPIMDVVPENEELILEARVPTSDVDKIRVGQVARVQLSAFDQATTPEAIGSVLSVSADRINDEQSGQTYYLTRLELGPDQPEPVKVLRLVSGMPATVFIQTGDRSPLSYLLKPLQDRLGRIFTDG